MVALLVASTLFASFEAIGDARDIALDGRCNYPAALGAPLAGETRTLCNHIEIRHDGAQSEIRFAYRGTTHWMRFGGALEGSRMTVRNAASDWVEARTARGSCTIFYKESRISAVSCVAQAGARSFVANFLVPQI